MDSKHKEDAISVAKTEDGSDTIFSPKFDSHYHSTHGARQESNHVFLNAGIDHYRLNHTGPISILEMGFGSGLNALMTYDYASANDCEVAYHTIEAYPIDIAVAATLNYGRNEEEQKIFDQFHQCAWDQDHIISDKFEFHKSLSLIEEVVLKPTYDIVFFDAFGPGSQPHLWEEALLGRICNNLTIGGLLVTYCAQGAFKRTLKAVGMKVEGIPGPPGKREMTRAIKL